MTELRNSTSGGTGTTSAYLDVTRTSDGRFCVAYIKEGINRRSYSSSVDQVILQARRAGGLPVRTNDNILRRLCEEEGLTLLDPGTGG